MRGFLVMNYSEKPNSVRCDFFKESGKWYEAFSLEINDWNGDIHNEIIKALKSRGFGSEGNANDGRWYVVLEPYNVHSHPVALKEEYIDWENECYGKQN